MPQLDIIENKPFVELQKLWNSSRTGVLIHTKPDGTNLRMMHD